VAESLPQNKTGKVEAQMNLTGAIMGKYPIEVRRKRLGGGGGYRSVAAMSWKRQCAVVIPCLNEAAVIAEVVISAQRFLPNVFVIDDGSQDDTGVLAKAVGAEVLRHELSRGKGAALQTGWRHARERGFKWAIAMDGDGQHSADDIPAFLDSVERTNAKLVVGNRMGDPKDMPWLRRRVNRWMSRRISSLAGLSLPDSQCGFRMVNLETWSALPVRAAHFEIESDVLLAFAVHGCAIEFVPIQVIYKGERSKIHPVRDTVRWFRWWREARRYMAEERAKAGLKSVAPVRGGA
jgi:glycosyltransferase involved in cell wall biosynthesis